MDEHVEGKSHLIVCAVLEGEIARDGGHGFGQAETGVRHLVGHNVGAVEGEVQLPPAAHVSWRVIQLHLDNMQCAVGAGLRLRGCSVWFFCSVWLELLWHKKKVLWLGRDSSPCVVSCFG